MTAQADPNLRRPIARLVTAATTKINANLVRGWPSTVTRMLSAKKFAVPNPFAPTWISTMIESGADTGKRKRALGIGGAAVSSCALSAEPTGVLAVELL